MSRILIVEDETHLAQGLQFNLLAEGHEASIAETGEAALELLRNGEGFDIVVLDVMLPGVSGFEVAADLRSRNDFVPILMLTARSRPEDVVRGFESGADDYLAKPFELSVLLARISALLRRTAWAQGRQQDATASGGVVVDPSTFTLGNRTIDLKNLEIRSASGVVRLTLMEADLLGYFVRHRGRVVSRKEILEDVWGLREDTDTRAVDNFIVRLRKYIEEEPSRPQRLLTVRGVGYRFQSGTAN
jgi:DNA-binding response OmpR family regulator